MKKLFKVLYYLAWFAAPALIVQYYSNNIDPMTPEEIKMATMAGTIAMVILAVFSGFGSGGRKAAKDAVKDTAKKAAKEAAKTAATAGPATRIIKDPATGAERIYEWNEKDGTWETDGGRTVLDESGLEDWERQRTSDRKWADDQMKKLRDRDTAFDRDMDEWNERQKKGLKELEEQQKRSRKFGERHGKYDLSDQEMRDYLDEQNKKNMAEGQKWTDRGNSMETAEKTGEWIQWGADFGMDICDVLTLGSGKPIKYIYIANRNLVNDFMDGLLNRRSLGQIVSKTVAKTFIDIKQDSVKGIGYKYIWNGFGDGVKESIQAAEEGKSVKEGFKSGFIKGVSRTGVEHGMSKVNLKWNAKQNEIANKAVKKSSEILGKQQAGQMSGKLASAMRNNIRTRAAQQIAAETAKTKDLLNTGLGRLSDGIWNQALQ